MNKVLDLSQKIEVEYCIPGWLRDEHIRINCRKVPGRIEQLPIRKEPLAIVCFGPSLKDTWEKVKDFKHIMTCSGSHKFLLERGIVPTWHAEVDPRKHKIALLGDPHPEVEYLPASTVHPEYVDHLLQKTNKIRLWHVFDTSSEGMRVLPIEEWALTGGCGIGLRCFTIGYLMGFREFHVFGMDGNERAGEKHAAAHPNQTNAKHSVTYEYPAGSGKMWSGPPAFIEAARQTPYEVDQLGEVKTVFYGEGLIQAIMRDHIPSKISGATIGLKNPALISEELRQQNRLLHNTDPTFGCHGMELAPVVLEMKKKTGIQSILDYGCGKGMLGRALEFPIWEYDPAVPGKEESPRAAELVVCSDVLEHIEPDKLDFVLGDLARVTLKVGLFTICTKKAEKSYPDGRNAHLIIKDVEWWKERLSRFFSIAKQIANRREMWFIVGPKINRIASQPQVSFKSTAKRRWDVLEELALQNKWTHGVEVGVKEGKTFLHLLAKCQDLHLTGVDLFEPRPGLEAEGGESHVGSRLPEHETNLRALIGMKYSGRASLIKGDSVVAAASVPDRSLDFVFIDADHREASVRADIHAWRPKVKPGGMLLGHDMQPKFPGVVNAVNDLCPGWKQYADSVWGVPCSR